MFTKSSMYKQLLLAIEKLTRSHTRTAVTRDAGVSVRGRRPVEASCDSEARMQLPSTPRILCDTSLYLVNMKQTEMKKSSEKRKYCRRAGCSKAEPNIFAPPQTPFPGVRDGQNLISWRCSLPSPTNPVWGRSMHAILSYRGNTHTYTHTNEETNPRTGPITVHCPTKLSAHCKYRIAFRGAYVYLSQLMEVCALLNAILVSFIMRVCLFVCSVGWLVTTGNCCYNC